MKNDFLNMLIKSIKNLIGKKSTQAILRYLASVTINYACNKFNIPIYKYDPLDMKNMIYHHNLNSTNKINPEETDRIIDLFSIERFVDELNAKDDVNKVDMNELVNNISRACNDNKIVETYNNMNENHRVLKMFDLDTLETSSIADNYEISSGGIYLPDRSIVTSTNEGGIIADAKNDYLEKRIALGDDVDKETLNKLLREYYDKIEFENVMKYYN